MTTPSPPTARSRAHEVLVDATPEGPLCTDVHSYGWEQRVCDRLVRLLEASDAREAELVRERDEAQGQRERWRAAAGQNADEVLRLIAERDAALARLSTLEAGQAGLVEALAEIDEHGARMDLSPTYYGTKGDVDNVHRFYLTWIKEMDARFRDRARNALATYRHTKGETL